MSGPTIALSASAGCGPGGRPRGAPAHRLNKGALQDLAFAPDIDPHPGPGLPDAGEVYERDRVARGSDNRVIVADFDVVIAEPAFDGT